MIDTHAHPLHRLFTAEPALGLADYLAGAHGVGVAKILGVACRRAEWAPMLQAATAHPMLRVIAGVHPHNADEAATEAELVALAQNPLVVGLGETGLDYHYTDIAPPAVQAASFHRHLQVAKAQGLPVVVHTRSAEADTIAILKEHPGTPFVLHCFSGSMWLAEQALAMGGYLSFSGILTFGKKVAELEEVARMAPRVKILIETDAPYLAPAPHRGRRNASSLLPHTAAKLAQLWQCSTEEVAAVTTQNAKHLFTRLS